MYHKLIHKLNKRLEDTDSSDSSMVVNATRALTAISTPSVKVVNSRADTMALRLGNPETIPDRSLTMWINVTKAVVSAPVPSMKKMSLAGFDRAQHSEEASQSTFVSKPSLAGKKRGFDKINDVEDVEDDDDDEEGNGEELNKVLSKEEAAKLFNEKQQSSLFPASLTSMGKIGANFEKTLRSAGLQESDHPDADLASHDVITQKRYFYRPPPDPKKAPTEIKVKKKTILGGESDEEQEGGGEGDDVEADAGRTEVDDHAQLVDAYFYGGEMVLTGDFEEAFGKLSDLKMGMDILHFMKTSDVSSRFLTLLSESVLMGSCDRFDTIGEWATFSTSTLRKVNPVQRNSSRLSSTECRRGSRVPSFDLSRKDSLRERRVNMSCLILNSASSSLLAIQRSAQSSATIFE